MKGVVGMKSEDNKQEDVAVKKPLKVVPAWEGKIRRVDNGFVFSYLSEMEHSAAEPVYREVESVFEDGVDRRDVCNWEGVPHKLSFQLEDNEIAMYHLLKHIADHFGVPYNKHRNVNLKVGIEVIGGDDEDKG